MKIRIEVELDQGKYEDQWGKDNYPTPQQLVEMAQTAITETFWDWVKVEGLKSTVTEM